MKDRIRAAALLVPVLAGCIEGSSPTSALLEQSVYTALGGMQVGEILTLAGDDAAEIILGGGATAGEFVYIPFHASEVGGANLIVNVTGEMVNSVDVDSDVLPAPSRSPFRFDPMAAPSAEMHERLHSRLQGAADQRLRAVRPSLSIAARDGLPIRADLSGGNARVGQIVSLNTSVADGFCTAVDLRVGRVEAITDRAIVVGDTANPANGFTRADYESFGNEFDDLVHPTITRFFADPTDIDENSRVIIFFTRAVNELTTDGSEGFIGGFFYARDLFPATGAGSCAASNEGEIFYVLAPDPNGEASPVEHARDDVFNDAVGTLGHEYVHLINAGRRIWVNDASELEASWLDEGLAHIAEEVLFYEEAGIGPGENLSVDDLNRPGVRDAINRFGVQNLQRYGLYLEEVASQSPTHTDDSLETRGATWAFLRYASDHSPLTEEEFFGKLIDTQLVGHVNLANVLEGRPLDWFQRWGVSIFTDDLVGSASPELQSPSWNFRSLLPRLFNEYPLALETLDEGEQLRLEIRSTSSGYVQFRGVAGEPSRLSTTSGGSVLPTTLRVTIVRIE